jgi:hypothetical protein
MGAPGPHGGPPYVTHILRAGSHAVALDQQVSASSQSSASPAWEMVSTYVYKIELAETNPASLKRELLDVCSDLINCQAVRKRGRIEEPRTSKILLKSLLIPLVTYIEKAYFSL